MIDLAIPAGVATLANLNRAKTEAAKAKDLDRFEWLLAVAFLEGALALAAAEAEQPEAVEQPAGGRPAHPRPPAAPETRHHHPVAGV
jgi:hypothetical protein